MECNVGSGEEQQLSCVQGDFRLLKAKVVLASQLRKAAMSSARQRCGGKKDMLNVGRRKERQQPS